MTKAYFIELTMGCYAEIEEDEKREWNEGHDGEAWEYQGGGAMATMRDTEEEAKAALKEKAEERIKNLQKIIKEQC